MVATAITMGSMGITHPTAYGSISTVEVNSISITSMSTSVPNSTVRAIFPNLLRRDRPSSIRWPTRRLLPSTPSSVDTSRMSLRPIQLPCVLLFQPTMHPYQRMAPSITTTRRRISKAIASIAAGRPSSLTTTRIGISKARQSCILRGLPVLRQTRGMMPTLGSWLPKRSRIRRRLKLPRRRESPSLPCLPSQAMAHCTPLLWIWTTMITSKIKRRRPAMTRI
mmetsp:Transcript_20291/g.47904  ORF Transcript_20291/g.47904 Transcript_20291/m.47904 type:complete len:223 (+) Transcript_20291:468-1136(+)